MVLCRYALFALIMIALAALFGCSDDDDDPVTPPVPEDPRVETVVMAPESVSFTAIGEDVAFVAMAFDQEGAAIDTVITWASSDPEVVAIDANGIALATGLGTAEVYAVAGSAADTADVTVSLGEGPVREWIADDSGNWEDAGNWSDGEVPGAGDVAVITAAGDYTVTINGDVDLDGLVLGSGAGTQTLDLNNFNLRVLTGGLFPGAELLVDDEFTVQGDFVWAGGDIAGGGVVELESSAELHVTGNPVNLDADINNNGILTAHAGSSLRINNSLDNNNGGVVDLQGDAYITVQNNGVFNSSGTIHKSQGDEEATISASSIDDSDFSFTGSLLVDVGSLTLRGGSLSGLVDIAEGAAILQAGDTSLSSMNARGEGDFVVGGRLSVGTYETQIVTFLNLVLDSASDPALRGPANVLVSYSLVWRRGLVADMGSFETQFGSHMAFEAGGVKALSNTTWNIRGDVAGDSNVDLALRNGAIISVESAGHWMQTTGGTISQGVGDAGRFDLIGEFDKTESGNFVVETEFTCSGTLNLPAGTLTVQGDFSLFDSGLITGGGTADEEIFRRLILVDAPSAVMRGTIRPGVDGAPARLGIEGVVSLEPTFVMELDVVTSGGFNADSVEFLTGGQVFGGTLALTAAAPASDGVDYRVVYAQGASGEFTVTGDEQFDTVIQDETGVLLRR